MLEEDKKEKSDEFYEHLQKAVHATNPKDTLVIGNLNAQVGYERTGTAIGIHGIMENDCWIFAHSTESAS